MIQDFLVKWINWYYGNDTYPGELQERMTYDEKIEAMKKTEQIKAIIGRSR